MSKRGSLFLLLAVLAVSSSCSSGDAEYQAAVEQLQIDQEIHDIRLKQAEEKLTDHQMRLDGQQRTLEALLDRLPAPLRKQVSAPAGATVKEVMAVSGTAQAVTQPARPKSPKSAEQTVYDQALTTLNNGQAQAAEKQFTDFMHSYPQSALAPNAEYWLGECFYTQQRYGEAILAFQSVAAQYPEHNKAAAALLKTGYAYERLNDPQNARFYLQQLLEYYPKSEPVSLARQALQRLQ